MGVVYRVHDRVSDRVVAQKRLVERSESERAASTWPSSENSSLRAHAIASFRREYHTLAQLAHPNIIEVYDFGIDELGPYYTMELLDGEDLRERAPLPWQEACAILRDIASALALLHSRRLLHRDISPRNVYYTRAGRAKLIDFGAMSPVGFDRVLAGTPPFVAPESFARQALDGRADIYALGALAYFILTGRNAYPARSIAELRDVWRAPPRLPSALKHDVPEVLDALVMRMLALDPQARPHSAVELVERLAALSGAAHDDERYATAVSAYLSAPTLIGRSAPLLGVRRRMLRALRSHGASLLVTGPSGIGRSRFLDACSLEAKLAGATVLRAGRGDAVGEFAGARALLEQLRTQLPEAELARFPNAALARGQPRRVSRPSPLPPRAATADAEINARSALHAELFDYLTELARRQLLAIIVDDVEDFDEPSLSLLASLAQVVRQHRLMIVCAAASDAPERTDKAARALHASSRAILLSALDADQVEDMLRSVFGQIPNLKLLAARLHDLSAGLPRPVMELCQHLLDSGVIKSRAGGFVLQPSFTISDLPASLRDAMQLRIDALTEDARMLGATLVLAGSAVLSVDECIELAVPVDAARTYRALSDLERVQLVTNDAHGLRLAKGYDTAFLERLAPSALQGLHARMAALFIQETRASVRAAKHHFAAGEEQRAIDALLAYARDDSAIRHWFSENRPVLERGIAACARLDRPKRDAFDLRRVLCRAISYYVEPADRESMLELVYELLTLAGAGFLAELAAEPDLERRARAALDRARERYDRLPERERVASPSEALTILTTYIGALASYASYVLDLELLRRIPSLFPFTTIAPGVALLQRIVDAVRDFRADRQLPALETTRGNIAALESEILGMGPAQRHGTRARLLYGIALTEAAFGRLSALDRARAVAESADHRVNAWHIRYIVNLFRPNARAAEECRREIELLQLQEGPRQFGEGLSMETEIIALIRTDDLLAVSRILPEIEARAARYPGWVAWLRIAEAELERMRNHVERAIALHREAIELAPAGETFAYMQTASLYIDLLVQVGRAQEAQSRGRELLARANRYDLDSSWLIEIALSIADATLGEHSRARDVIERVLRLLEERELFGLYRGLAHEAAARIALEAEDTEAFRTHFDQAWIEYGAGAYPPLAARLEKLMTMARRKKLARTVQEESTESAFSVKRVRDELARAHGQGERAERALALLMQASQAVAGHLYGIRGVDIELLASHALRPPNAEIEHMIRTFLHGESEEERTLSLHELAEQRPSLRVAQTTERDGFRYFLFLLSSDKGAHAIAAGVVALAFADGKRGHVVPPLMAAIGDELLASRDVTGLTLSG